MGAVAIIPCAVVGGALFRIRGGWFDVGSTTIGRAIWATGMTLLAVALDWFLRRQIHIELVALAPVLYLGAIPPWWGSIDLGHNDGETISDAISNANRGITWTVLASPILTYADAGAWWGLVGLACPIWYTVGWYLRGPQNTQEWLFGGWLGATLAAAFMWS